MKIKSALKKKIEKLVKTRIISERGERCELCGKPQSAFHFKLSLFHILSRTQAPRLMYNPENLLLACWSPAKFYYMPYCHNIWHHADKQDPKYIAIVNKIKQLRGEDYHNKLMALDRISPKLTELQLQIIYNAYKCNNPDT